MRDKLFRTTLAGATGLLLVATPVVALVMPGGQAASEVPVPELSAPTPVAPPLSATPLTLSPRTPSPETTAPRTSAPRTEAPETAEAPEPPDRPRPPEITVPLLPDLDPPGRPGGGEGGGRPGPDKPPVGDTPRGTVRQLLEDVDGLVSERCAALPVLGDRLCAG